MKRISLQIYIMVIIILLFIFGCVVEKTPVMEVKTFRGSFLVSYDVIQYLDTAYTVIEDSYTARLYEAKAYNNKGEVRIFRTDYYNLNVYKITYNKRTNKYRYIPIISDAVVKRF